MAKPKPHPRPKPWIKERWEALGLDQNALAKRSGVTQGTISRITSGESGGTRASLKKLADALYASVEFVEDGKPDPGPPPMPLPDEVAAVDRAVERDARAELDPDDAASPLERALSQAFDASRHLIRDAEAVKTALRATYQKQRVEADLVDAARTWLDCAAQLRREGVAVTTEELLFRVTIGRRPSAHDRETATRVDAEAEARQRAEHAARGGEWGSRRGALEEAGKSKRR